MPNGSLTPWITSTGTATASSSLSRVFSGFPGGWTGNARHSTPADPVAAAVRQATRAGAHPPPPRLPRLPGRGGGNRDTHPAGRSGRSRGGAGHPRARGATAGDEREVAQVELLDHAGPGRVQLRRRSRRLAAGHAVWL